ncbi:uncharacterized protein CLUP02_06037 [Colletotrichum lupini]|uniref:Uncharacterized protein n=1 Tax=Colletotrichum lupini TaxID=145971 RepID=A0A9Q8SNB8_9PEZI|nr:uncharacterized protein CLUP02_06037 [Colletotrichum lupini]UQC80554.1 hypothetical protein CLUP02_06037 [Colletotrichum lupini]
MPPSPLQSSTPTGWHPRRLPSHCICIAWLLNPTLISDWAAFLPSQFSDSEDDTPLTQHHLVLCLILPRKTSERRVGVAQPSTGHPQSQRSKRRHDYRTSLRTTCVNSRGMPPPPARPSIPSCPGGPFQAPNSQKQELISAQTRFVHLQFDLILVPRGRLVAINPSTPTSFHNQMDSIDVKPDIVRDAYNLPTSSLPVRTRPISIAAVDYPYTPPAFSHSPISTYLALPSFSPAWPRRYHNPEICGGFPTHTNSGLPLLA